MVAKNEFYPLSYPQKGIWYLEKMYPSTSMGNISATLKFETNLDVQSANDAVNHLMKTNEGLRLRITEIDGEAYQYVSEYKYQQFDYFDFSDKDISELYKWDTKTNEVPIYNIDTPLVYIAIIKISDTMAAFFAKLHHLISDAWTHVSMGNEAITNYFKIIHNQPLALENKPSYLEYLESEKKYFTSPRYFKDEDFWLNKFNKIPELTALKNRKLISTSLKSSRKSFKLPEKLCNKIHQHFEVHKTSLFSLYMGAMAIYINRTKGLDEIVFGTPVLNRSNHREKNTMGMFISTVPIVIKVDDSLNYEDFTDDITKEWMTLLRHQKYPYLLLLKKLREKNPGLDNLYDIVISYQNAKFLKTGDDHFQEARWHQNKEQTETLYIHLNDREDNGEIIINYDYLTDLFYPKEIDFLHDHVIRLLWHFIDNPLRQLPYIEMISEKEKQKILYDFNDTMLDIPNRHLLHTLFEMKAEEIPDDIALIFENTEMSYCELNERINAVAHKLINNGIGVGDIVGFMVPRSFSTIIAMLGILKSGAAYMPIDRNFPYDRVNYILNDSKAKAIITEKSLFDSSEFDGYVLDINSIQKSETNKLNPKVSNNPEDSACVIYTSGSTGLPKGVEISHRSFSNFVPAMTKLVDFDSTKTFISITSESFDIFLLETLLPLTQGLRVLMTNENEQRIPHMLHDLMLRYDVDMIQTTPTRMNYIINHLGHYAGFENLKEVILGGEVFKDALLAKLKKITNAKIYNGYGPSETTIYSTFKELTDTCTINIGKPVPNTRIYIVDKYYNLMPIGSVGNLCITGEGVMKGYIGNNALNEERLVECPFEPGNKMFLTGDLASWYGQGEIEYIGRNDNQVKVNGLRIECGEIETQLLKNKGLIETVITIWEDDAGKPQICAYYVSDNELSSKELRQNLSEKLPTYMIPSYFMRLDVLPLTTGGKIDRASLPQPIFKPMSERIYEPPSNKLENILTKAYASILKFSDIGINDHFFELGGDSLGVIELVSLLFKKGYSLEIRDVYKAPIIKELKNYVLPNRLQIVKTWDNLPDANLMNMDIYDKIQDGSLPRLDSAAITYLPIDNAMWTGLSANKPIMYKHMSLDMGNIGMIALPIGISQLYNESENTLKLCVEAARIAENSGARVVSLTGLIPSATGTGRNVEKAVKKAGLDIKVTTGHATTTATVILSLLRLLEKSNRQLINEDACVLGVGSIGSSVIKLMLSKLPHPRTIILCDLPSRVARMQEIKKELITKFGYTSKIRLVYSDGVRLPDEVYKATLILGATNVPNILDTDWLQSGTLIVDDSGPHCFSPGKAKNRILKKSDLLITEGGMLEIAGTIKNELYLPVQLDEHILTRFKSHFTSEKEITGCILSGLLSAFNANVKPSTGLIEISDSIKNYTELVSLGYKGANLHFEDFVIPNNHIRKFILKYNNSDNTRQVIG